MSAKTKVMKSRRALEVAQETITNLRGMVRAAFAEGHAMGGARVSMGMDTTKDNCDYDWKQSDVRARLVRGIK